MYLHECIALRSITLHFEMTIIGLGLLPEVEGQWVTRLTPPNCVHSVPKAAWILPISQELNLSSSGFFD